MGGDFQPMGHVNVVVNRYFWHGPASRMDFPAFFRKLRACWLKTQFPHVSSPA